MKILLIQPQGSLKIIDEIYMNEPLALEYLGAGLKRDGHEAAIHDVRLEPDCESAFLAMQPDVVGLTGVTSQVKIVKRIAARLKTLRPEVFIVVGGHHATVAPADYNDPAIDLTVIGEGVGAIREIVRCLENKQSFDDIEGLGIPGEVMRFTKPRIHPPLDEMPFPDRSLTSRWRKHYFNDWLKPVASIRTSLGCDSRCTFCSAWKSAGGKYLRRQPEKIVEELKAIAEPYVYFVDDESMLDARRMERLADLIREAGIRKKYYCYARVDSIVRHRELFAKWKAIGLSIVFIGFESFSDERLDAMKKNVTIAQQAEAVRILNELGIFIFAQFVVDPAFDRSDFKAMADYIRKLKLKYASFTVLTPLPGTTLYQERESELISRNPELIDVFHSILPTRLPLNDFYLEYADLYIHSVSLWDGLRTLLKYGLRRIPQQIKHGNRFIAQMREGWRDHEEKAEIILNPALTG